jgi:hypothetical protein
VALMARATYRTKGARRRRRIVARLGDGPRRCLLLWLLRVRAYVAAAAAADRQAAGRQQAQPAVGGALCLFAGALSFQWSALYS